MEILIREARVEDGPDLARMARETFLDTYQEIARKDQENMNLYLAEALSDQKIASLLENPQNTFLLAEKQQELLGYVKLVRGFHYDNRSDPSFINLEKIYLRRHAQSQGIGQRFMHHSLDIAAREGFSWIWLGVWDVNQSAIRFYERFGFAHCGVHHFKMGEHIYEDLLFKKKLEETP